MSRVNYTNEQITLKVREVEELSSQGKTIAEAAKEAGITEQNFYRWRKESGSTGASDMKRPSDASEVKRLAVPSDVKRLKELEKENSQLKILVAELSLDNAMLKDINAKYV